LRLAVEDLEAPGSNNLDHIQVLKKAGGSMRDTYLESGFLLDKQLWDSPSASKRQDSRTNTSMDTDKIKIYGSRVKVDSIDKVADIERGRGEDARTKVTKILAHVTSLSIVS
jgi:T-complex protein 1 subunit beta